MYTYGVRWPSYSSDPADIEKFHGKSPLGLDLEFKNDRPTILGISDGVFHLSVPYEDGRPYLIDLFTRFPDTKVIGHSFISADLPLLVADGVPLKLENVLDSIILWWLTNPHLSKSSGKGALDEEGGTERRGRGFNNLWTMASVHTDFAHWKDCRKPFCEGPCPDCTPYHYNAVDSAAPVLAWPKMMRQAQIRGVDKLYNLHRDLARDLADIQAAGIRIDVPFVYGREKHRLGSTHGQSLDEQFRFEKSEIEKTLPFNPRSPKAIVEYFKGRGVDLEDAQEATIEEAVEDLADGAPTELVSLLDFKQLGNGVDRWYLPQYKDEKGWLEGYLDPSGYIHPRTAFFTSSARLMQSGPNMQNVGKRRRSRILCECGKTRDVHPVGGCGGFIGESIGKRIRKAVIAPEGWYIVRADLSNAEGRTVLYHAGYTDVPKDIHSWMVENIGLKPDDPICKALGGPRDAAKSVVHACVPGDHEVLTPWGWLPIRHWTKGMPVAQWETETQKVSFVTPSAYHEYDVDEDIQVISGRGFAQRTTLNHEFPSLTSGTWNKRIYDTWHRTTFEKIPKSARLPVTGVLENGNEIFEDVDIRRAIAIQADASYINGNHYCFHVVKKRKKDRLRELFGKELKPCTCHLTGVKVSGSFVSPLLDNNKSFTCAVLNLSQRQRLIFLEEILFWDGSVNGFRKIYSNTDKVSLDWAQTVAHLSGQQSLLRKNKFVSGFNGIKQGYTLAFNNRQFTSKANLEYRKARFEGKVYCLTVPAGYFLIRYRDTISVTGNSNYMEGLQLKEAGALRTDRMKKEIACGARVVFWDWTFEGKVVTFTGVNLARRAFGEATFENRRRALEVMTRYIDQSFPKVRDFHKRVMRQVEKEKAVHTPHGYVLMSYGPNLEDRIKTAVSVWGQQTTAQLNKLGILDIQAKYRAGRPMRVFQPMHDELLCYVKNEVAPREAMSWIKESMQLEMAEMPGLQIPADPSYGPDWASQST